MENIKVLSIYESGHYNNALLWHHSADKEEFIVEELQAACSRFNALAVGDIDRLDYDKHIYKNMNF